MKKSHRRYAERFANIFFEDCASKEEFRGPNFNWQNYLDFVRRMSYIQSKGEFNDIAENERKLIGELSKKTTEQLLKEKKLI